MKKFTDWMKKHRIVLILILIIIALFFAIYYFIGSLRKSSSEGVLHSDYYYHRANGRIQLEKRSQKLSVNDIQSWMTFDYITVVFKLPANYLKNILGINDPHYPNIRLDSYAKNSHIEQTVLLTTIKQYVRTYTTQ